MTRNFPPGSARTLEPEQGRVVRRRGPRTPDDWFATWLRRLRWPMVIIWLIAIVLLNPLSSGLSKVTDNSASANLPPSPQSTKVVNLQEAALRGGSDNPAVVGFARSSGTLTPAELVVVNDARTAVARLHGHDAALGPTGPV